LRIMITKNMIVILLAMAVAAYGAAGAFYAGAQVQTAAQEAEITVNGQARPGSEINVSGSDFAANSDVSIYVMSSTRADLSNASAFIMQETSANETSTTTATEPRSGGLLDDALNALENLLDMNGGNVTSSANQGSLLVALEQPASGTISLECNDEEIAEADLDDTNLASLAASSGTYNECSISISDGNTTEIGEIGDLTINPDPDASYESSEVATVTADAQGSFAQSVTVPEVDQGQYAILAVSAEGNVAVSELAITLQPEAETTSPNVTSAVNETATFPDGNTMVAQNQTAANETGTSAEASVRVDEANAEPGEPLPISGEGFQPNAPVQIFINNVQITNIVTNIEGSFNTVVIVPTTVNAGNAEVVVKTGQINIVRPLVINTPSGQNEGPATVRFTAVSATDNAQALRGAPFTVFDASSGQMVDSGKTPRAIELEAGIYSVFYSDFRDFNFRSAEPGIWMDTPGGGSGLITVREGRNATVTAMYSEEPAPPAPPRESVNSLTLRAEDTDGETIEGMFVTVYDANTGKKIEQGFTELTVEDLPPGTYPIFFANFANLDFVSASPGSWIQTPFGGAGLVTIPDDGEDHDITVTAVYDRTTAVAEEQFNIQAPLDIRGNIFTITSNQTRPEGPFVISGSFALRVSDEDPLRASLSAYVVSAREDSNENVDLESQRSRDHDTFQIVDFKPRVARPVGLDSYLVSGTADLLLDGNMYSNDERIEVMVRGGEEMTPTNVEIEFQGDHRYSAAHRLETLFGAVASGFQ
jgi:hypothetical protein